MENRKKKNFCWCETSIEILIHVWQENINDLRRAKHNSHVYREMKNKLEEYGIYCDIPEISNKIKNLTQKYRNEKKIIGPSGGIRSDWKWFDKVNEILGRLAINNSDLIEESIENVSNTEEVLEVEYLKEGNIAESDANNTLSTSSTASQSATENPSKRRKCKMIDIHQDMLQEMRKLNKIEEDRNKREERYLELSSQFMKDSIDKQERANTISERVLSLAEDSLRLQERLVNSITKK